MPQPVRTAPMPKRMRRHRAAAKVFPRQGTGRKSPIGPWEDLLEAPAWD
jgi:hypothetical protein